MSTADLRSGFKKMMYGEGAMWDTFLKGVAELVGTSILVFLGCMGCVGSLGVSPPHVQITLTFGLAVMIVIQCIGHISHAHVNPAITVGAVVLGKKSAAEGTIYIASQLIGGVLGYGLLKLVTPTGFLTQSSPEDSQLFCITNIHPSVSCIQGLIVEAMATGILMLIACALWDERNASNTDSTAIKFGLAVTGLATVAGPYTGCSMNPARSFAPAIWNNQWTNHWIYWLGPAGGAFLAALSYRMIFGLKEEEDEETIPETVALNCVEAEKPEL
ncbi:aquaporin AQPcic-like isoform X2 [Venturia canescens]|uniref:aquaporin AQPcic-like isoform X2 n=1 Tax=Venturia canescens TaxID=32260 RepID=UPI001C9D475E|nr:aquaporin AQPcic-like isoform X2 [Venturia canescens]XP_043289061.1 aquaporin AQPcic-like isoform X2 [Venturia canescens]